MSGILAMYDTASNASVLDESTRIEINHEVIDQINHDFPSGVLQSPGETDRQRIRERVEAAISLALRKRNCRPGVPAEAALVEELTRRITGLGFLDLLLPPTRTDISEITIYSSGLVQIMPKGSVRWETTELRPEPGEIWRVLDRLIGPQNKTLNETNPSINAKLPPTPHNPGGGRIKALHPVIAPPGRNPSINIRLYEQKPVLPEWLIDHKALSSEMMDDLKAYMQSGKRTLICGGTRTGKTTMLSALCNFLPVGWRILKIEDPEEIWIDRTTVQTLEARPQAVGTDVRSYRLADGVDDAMRMSPDYLIIGEVRDGIAAMSLFRALMTGHSGACTFHADSPRETADRLAGLMGADMGINRADALRSISGAIDLQIQIGIRYDKRRVISISQVEKELKNGVVTYNPLWRYDETSSVNDPRWARVGDWKRSALDE